MATRTATKPDEEETASDGVTEEKVRSWIADALSDFRKPETVTEDPAPKTPAKPKTMRAEESEMESHVLDRIAELLDKEAASAEKHDEPTAEKAPPEQAPGAPSVRRLTKIFGWGE